MAVDGAVADPVVAEPTPASATPDPKAAPTAGAKPAASQPDYKWEEDTRTKGTLADLQKERKARQDYERRVAESETQLAEERRRVAALTGIATPSKEELDVKAVREQLAKVYPELAQLGSIGEIKAELERQAEMAYAGHSNQMLDRVYKGISAEYGELTEAQKKRVGRLYFAENYHDPEFHKRHNQGDPTLVAEFVKGIVDDLVEPIRKKVTASEASRFRPVPGGRDRSTPIKGEKPKSGEDMLRAHFKAHARG